ncbi:MAG: chemotaxis protein CheW [Sedimentibacter sp.]
MDDNFDSILDMYLFEANSLLEQLDEILLKAENEQAFDKECIDEIFRLMHTIKGSSAMMQFDSITTISHKVEDLFYFIRENGINEKFNEELVNMVFKFTDFIKVEISKIEEGKPLEENLEVFVEEIHGFLQIISGDVIEDNQVACDKNQCAITNEVASKTNNENSDEKYEIKIIFDDDIGMENLRAFLIVNQLNENGIKFTYKPENVDSISETAQEIVKEGFFVYLNKKEFLDPTIRVVKEALNVKNYTVTEYNSENSQENKDAENLTGSLNTQNVKTENSTKHSKQNLINVNLSKLDSLLNIVGELVIAESMIAANDEINKLELESFAKATRHMRKLTDELQDIVMSLRMVPVAGIFQKMKRIVRDMGKELNKDVELVLSGEETEIDKTIVDGISDPIMHLVRNSMDHGIESTEDRINKGKSQKGTIKLSASNVGGEIHITVEDDGKGFESKRILAKAKTKDLLKKPESEYTSREIFQFLMLPGFSTNEAVTEYSGRGVGMDVVKFNVEKVGGNVILDSKEDVGTVVTFKIPLTLTIVLGMQIIVGNSEFIIPIKNIQQSFITTEDKVIHNTDGKEMILVRDKCYPILRIHEIFNIDTNKTNIEEGILMIVESGDRSVCLFVDKIVGEQQVVVKPMPSILTKYNLKQSGISGCTILGNGSINLILDVENLIESM